MNSTQIIGAILLATGKPVPEVAEEFGYSKHTFYRVINGETHSPKVQGIIVSIISKQLEEIWPESVVEGKRNGTPPGRTSGLVVSAA